MKTAAEILDGAKELLIKDGWTQRTYVNDQGEHCAIGAVRAVGLYDFDDQVNNYFKAYDCLQDACQKLHMAPVVVFNDRDSTTLEDILEVFDEAKVCANG